MSTAEAIAAIAKTSQKSGPAEACVVCLEDISEGCKALPCRHTYDYLCLLSWLELRQTCPLCNGLVESIEVFDRNLQRIVRVRFPAAKCMDKHCC